MPCGLDPHMAADCIAANFRCQFLLKFCVLVHLWPTLPEVTFQCPWAPDVAFLVQTNFIFTRELIAPRGSVYLYVNLYNNYYALRHYICERARTSVSERLQVGCKMTKLMLSTCTWGLLWSCANQIQVSNQMTVLAHDHSCAETGTDNRPIFFIWRSG